MIDSLFARWGLEGPLWLFVASAAIFLLSLLLALILYKLVYPVILRFTRWTPINLDARLVQALRKPLTLAVALLGLYLAIILPHELPSTLRSLVDLAAGMLGLLLGVIASASAVSHLFQWYIEVISPRTSSSLDDRLIPMLRRVALVVVYGLGALLALDLLQVNISPLIAGLGLSGLAVALALQPTLANLFAGTYVMTEGVVNPGDYIELESGVAGYVIDVSWRSTRLRTWTNNLVVVPNSRFAETIITNFQRPIPAVNVYLTCGVSYDSDLLLVEQVCREVMDDLLEKDPRAVKEYGSYFGFEDFDDSNVGFYLFVQARDRLASFEVRSLLIQEVRQRFREEGIVINYPMRTLNLSRGWNPETAAQWGEPAVQAPPRARAGECPGSELRPRQGRRPPPGGQEAPASNVVGDAAADGGPDI